ncbi:acetyl-CoA carboxylase biotin carboxyl carrier protein [Sphingobium sp. AR-3-1]|uniref:Biotin carboxyl carrier protein of acetyl-CoA carboxylase n=1 Tax=Sphingobium psychrophilum TaxID=2728834 RepID=A0A7X9WY26_9SPHN|nr:acetyl-CoA carboxylase biotin carboxyl carrier protein [Sphingobium psychrophilum]NML12046.1 acetyl-CoA carboxylase biotin carboxyl carrier protein [Sphingobium psychrophilum]
MTGHDFPDALKQLLDEFSRSGIRELHIRKPDFELYVSTDASAARPQAAMTVAASASAPAAQPAATQKPIAAPIAPISSLPDDAVIINAPNLGTFYRAPKPGTANYVEVGSKVQAGDELCLIEVMKLFTAVRAGASGTVHAVLVEDGAMVEGGQPLFALVRD